MTVSAAVQPCVELLRRIFSGRKVIVAMGAVAGSGKTAARLRDLGARTPLLLGDCTGTGDPPAETDFVETHVVGIEHAGSVMEGIRSFAAALADLPPVAAAAVERYDPDRTALVLAAPYLDIRRIAGRAVFGAARPAWVALEDKVVVDALWDAVGVPRVPARVVPARRSELEAAAAALDRGAGTVWAADARDGFHGGADGTRWVRPGSDAADVIAFMGACADHVRVMPFLEGIPCSIHGFVIGDDVISIRPVEQITLRCPGAARFHYGGAATFWDPPDVDTRAMRDLAGAVGRHLKADLDYRGAFTIDGVLTEEGFRPTEINTRFGAGLAAMAASIPDLPLLFLNMAFMAGETDGVDVRRLERFLRETADEKRGGVAKGFDSTARTGTECHDVVLGRGGTFEPAGDRPRDAEIKIGPAPVGGIVLLRPEPERTPTGPSLAPRTVAAMAYADRHLGSSFGPREAARDVRDRS